MISELRGFLYLRQKWGLHWLARCRRPIGSLFQKPISEMTRYYGRQASHWKYTRGMARPTLPLIGLTGYSSPHTNQCLTPTQPAPLYRTDTGRAERVMIMEKYHFPIIIRHVHLLFQASFAFFWKKLPLEFFIFGVTDVFRVSGFGIMSHQDN